MNNKLVRDEIMVSVIMITYGHERYIADAINGVYTQVTNFKFELIIANDRSPDNSDILIQDLIKDKPENIEIQYICREKNLGANTNFVDAANRAKGKYIALCEGDDFWTDLNKLQMQVDFLESHNEFVMTCHNAEVRYDDTERDSHLFNDLNESQEIFPERIINDWVIPTASMVFRSCIISNLPSWFVDIYSGDYTIALLNMDRGRIYCYRNVMSVYRVILNGNSASSLYRDKVVFMHTEHIRLLGNFNVFSNERHTELVNRRIKFLENEIRFIEFKNKSLLFAFWKMPYVFLMKLFNKFKIS